METEFVLSALSGLAHDTRLALYRRLVIAGPAGVPAGQLGEALDLAPATLSFHLKELRNAGLVTQRRDGRSIFYAADCAFMNELIAYLTENCCQGIACTPALVTSSKPPKQVGHKRKSGRSLV
ncbi:MAG: metalloregulator ArsR/SmtB family transcription factor [Gammaproteobacteria bacterium]